MNDYAASQDIPEYYTQGRFLNIVKMPNLPKPMYTFNIIPINIQARLFVDIEKVILIFMGKNKGTKIAKIRRGWEESNYPIFKTYIYSNQHYVVLVEG